MIDGLARRAPVLFDLRSGRVAQKREYGGELFPVRAMGELPDRQILLDFQGDLATGRPKGIIAIELDTVP